MAYTPTEWKAGDVITAEKLNNMEDGIVGAGRALMVTATSETDVPTFNKTLGEIKAAVMAGIFVWVGLTAEIGEQTVAMQGLPTRYTFNEGGGGIIVFQGNEYTAPTDNDYPAGRK
jgi:hypothetical protein